MSNTFVIDSRQVNPRTGHTDTTQVEFVVPPSKNTDKVFIEDLEHRMALLLRDACAFGYVVQITYDPQTHHHSGYIKPTSLVYNSSKLLS